MPRSYPCSDVIDTLPDYPGGVFALSPSTQGIVLAALALMPAAVFDETCDHDQIQGIVDKAIEEILVPSEEETSVIPDFVATRDITVNVPSVAGLQGLTGWTTRKGHANIAMVEVPGVGDFVGMPSGSYIRFEHWAWATQFSQVGLSWSEHTFSYSTWGMSQRAAYGELLSVEYSIGIPSETVLVQPVFYGSAASSLGLGYAMTGHQQQFASRVMVWL